MLPTKSFKSPIPPPGLSTAVTVDPGNTIGELSAYILSGMDGQVLKDGLCTPSKLHLIAEPEAADGPPQNYVADTEIESVETSLEISYKLKEESMVREPCTFKTAPTTPTTKATAAPTTTKPTAAPTTTKPTAPPTTSKEITLSTTEASEGTEGDGGMPGADGHDGPGGKTNADGTDETNGTSTLTDSNSSDSNPLSNGDPAAAVENKGGLIAGVVIGALVLILLTIGATVWGYKRCGQPNTNNGNSINISTSNMVTNQAALAPATAARGPLNNSISHITSDSTSTDDPDLGLYYAEPVLQQAKPVDPDLVGYGHAGAASTYEYAPVVQAIQQSAAGKAAGVTAEAGGSKPTSSVVYATYAPTPTSAPAPDDNGDAYEMPAEIATSAVVNGVVVPMVTYAQDGSTNSNGAGGEDYEMPAERATSAIVNGVEVPLDFNGC